MTQKKRILLLDDNYESLEPLKVALAEIYGYEVELSAEETLLKRLGSEKFDLLIVDHMISPNGLDGQSNQVKNIHFEGVHWHHTGPEFVERLRAGNFSSDNASSTPADVPVIMLSAVANASTPSAEQKKQQISAYMEKPFDLEELIEKIQAIFEESKTK